MPSMSTGTIFGQLPYANGEVRPTDLLPQRSVDGGRWRRHLRPGTASYSGPPARTPGGRDSDSTFRHAKHVFTDSASYFVGIDVEARYASLTRHWPRACHPPGHLLQ